MTRLHLIDLVDRARVTAPRPDHVAIEHVTLEGDTRSAIFQHPDSRIEFPVFRWDRSARLCFAVGLRQTAWDRVSSPIEFSISLSGPLGRRVLLFQHTLNAEQEVRRHDWREFEVTLPRARWPRARLILETRVPAGASPAFAWAAWADPVIEGVVPARRAPRRRLQPAVVLITCDALRPDVLSCYGHPEVETPNLDQLASAGCRFEHARASSPATAASYASLVSGRHPARLGVHAEWGSADPLEMDFVRAFRRRGYQTVLAPSELDFLGHTCGGDRGFDTVIPLLGRPDQDGGLTTRRVLKWLEAADDRPRLLWIQYFDAHPPTRSPRAQAHRFLPGPPATEKGVPPQIHGVESVLEIDRALPRLEDGHADFALAARLGATADAQAGLLPCGPDLAALLPPLAAQHPNEAGLRVAPDDLRRYAGEIAAGRVSAATLAWLRTLRRHLAVVEAEITASLDSLTSLDEAVRSYWGQVAYLDSHIGALLEGLRSLGMFDTSTIVFTSPHGEGLGEQGVTFHHHALIEACLRVPLIIKPASGPHAASVPGGTVVGGIFSLLDLPATILDASRVASDALVDSRSRWGEATRDASIGSRDSIALGPYRTQAALVQDNRKLVYAFEDHWFNEDWNFRRGEARLLETEGRNADGRDLSRREPDRARRMRDQLLQWASGMGLAAADP